MRYIAVEHDSGFIWGDTHADSPEAACVIIDLLADASHASSAWVQVPPIRDTDGGYHLYTVPESFPQAYGGQDQDIIDQLWLQGKHIGCYRPLPAAEPDPDPVHHADRKEGG